MDSRWASTASSIWIQATTGGSYAFSIYSPLLKSSQSYSQSTLDMISVFKDIGANAGVISGLLYSSTSKPWLIHALGSLQCFLGYFFIWSAVVGLISPPSVSLMCFFMFLAAHAQTFFNTANVVTAVNNFKDYKGTIVGIMKGFLGLSGAILIQVYQAFFMGNPTTFILMLALLPTFVSFSLMFLVRIRPRTGLYDYKYLNAFSIVALLLAAYLMLIIILENVFVFPHWARLFTILGLLILLSSPLHISIQAINNDLQPTEVEPTQRDPLLNYGVVHVHPNEDVALLKDAAECESESESESESMNLVEAMKTFNFWLLFIAMSCGMGSGLATINNMSQIGQSLGYDTVKINTMVSLWSIWNFLGRFGGGYISDYLLRQKGWARTLVMTITLATMTAGHITIGSGFLGNLYIGTILVGICYGAQWGLMPTITSEIFGILHMGTIFNTIAIASPMGTYVLSVLVIGRIYDKEAGEGHSCYGVHCFMKSFFILAFVSFLGFLAALTLFFRTRAFYNEGSPFTATLWAGMEGFHMTANGRHETSFKYRENLEPWMVVSKVRVTGGVSIFSGIAKGLLVSEDLDISNGPEENLDAIWLRQCSCSLYFHKNAEVNLDLWKEAQAYGDIQVMPFVDYYSFISLKTIVVCILELFKLEDVAMGIWIDTYKNIGHEIKYISDDRFYNTVCDTDYILARYQNQRKVLCLWEKLQKEHQAACCE